jgi:hypothetical protein
MAAAGNEGFSPTFGGESELEEGFKRERSGGMIVVSGAAPLKSSA